MADFVDFKGRNLMLGKPKDMTDEECGSLPVLATVDNTLNCPCLISCWELNESEREEVVKTGRVWLKVIGVGHPPVSVSGDGFNEVYIANEGK